MSAVVFEGHAPGTSSYRRLLAGLFCAGVATFAQLYSPQALLPLIAADLGAPPATAALAVSASTMGVAVAVLPWSLVADRIGRVQAMAIGIIAATILGLSAPFAADVALLLGIRLAEGVALGAVPAVALAYLSEEVNARHTASAAGSYIAGTTVGGLTGRLISGPLGEVLGWRAGIWATVVVCALCAILFLLLIPKARGFVPGRMADAAPSRIHERVLALLRSPRQLVLYAQGFLLMGAFVAVYNYLGFHLSGPPFALPTWLVTMLFLAYLAGTLSSPWAGRIASSRGRRPVLLVSIVGVLAGVGLMAVPIPLVVLAGLLVFTAGFFGAHAVASGWAPVDAPAESRAQASSLYYFAYYAGSSLFGWLLGLVFGAAGWECFLLVVAGMCALSGLLVLVVLRGGAGRMV